MYTCTESSPQPFEFIMASSLTEKNLSPGTTSSCPKSLTPNDGEAENQSLTLLIDPVFLPDYSMILRMDSFLLSFYLKSLSAYPLSPCLLPFIGQQPAEILSTRQHIAIALS